MKARSDQQVPYLAVNRDAPEPLHQQIVRQVTAAIAAGTLRTDVRLPASRILARILRISRNTVVTAYSELIANGLIRAKRGAGVRVNGAAPLSGMPLAGMRGLIEAAHFPSRVLELEDSDANPVHIRY